MEESSRVRTWSSSLSPNKVETIPVTKRAPYTPKEQTTLSNGENDVQITVMLTDIES